MKKIGIIAFAVVAVAIAAIVLLMATLPTAKVTIVAIGPTSWSPTQPYLTNGMVVAPEWWFGVTNVGRATARWSASIKGQQSNYVWQARETSIFFLGHDEHKGVLKPGEGLVTTMIVNEEEWASYASCSPKPTPFQNYLWNFGFRIPYVRSLLSRRFTNTYVEPVWHTTTNARLATVTNTP